MSKRISVERAILIGLIWVNGSVLFGFAFPLVLMGVLGEMGAFDRLSGASTLVLALGLLAARVRTHSQKSTVAARATAERKTVGHRS